MREICKCGRASCRVERAHIKSQVRALKKIGRKAFRRDTRFFLVGAQYVAIEPPPSSN